MKAVMIRARLRQLNKLHQMEGNRYAAMAIEDEIRENLTALRIIEQQERQVEVIKERSEKNG